MEKLLLTMVNKHVDGRYNGRACGIQRRRDRIVPTKVEAPGDEDVDASAGRHHRGRKTTSRNDRAAECNPKNVTFEGKTVLRQYKHEQNGDRHTSELEFNIEIRPKVAVVDVRIFVYHSAWIDSENIQRFAYRGLAETRESKSD